MPARPAPRVELLGGFRVFRDDRVAVPAPGARQQEIIAYLILQAAASEVPRARVAGAVWPESTDQQALTNLRRELHHLREARPELDHLIEAGARTLAWRGSADVIVFDAAVERGLAGNRPALDEAARLYQGDLMPDCAGEWIDVERARLRQRAAAALTHLVGLLERERAFDEAIARTEQLLRIDPLREDAYCVLMRCHAGRGDRAAALRVYQDCAALLKRELGVQPGAATRIVHREILDLGAQRPAIAAAPRPAVYPLVGRDEEWREMLRAWGEAEQGRSRLLVLRGEAGIGKTRLAEELVDWCRVKNVAVLTARCYAGEGRLAYSPIAAWLKGPAMQRPLGALDASVLVDVARLHPGAIAGRADVTAPDGRLESWQRVRFFDALTQAFRSAAPLVMHLDDLQWADGDTIEWLQYFIETARDSPCLVVATVRAEEEEDNPPLGRLLRQLAQHDALSVLALGRLDRAATAQLAAAVAEHPLDDAAVAGTFRDTEGHPLFIVERGRMPQGDAARHEPDNALSRVQSVVAARLALLSPDARALAEVAAAVGRDFSVDILQQASGLEEAAVASALDELWRRHIVRPQGDRWDFTHDRIREVAYAGIGPARAPLVHRRIARAMEQLSAGRLDEVSAMLAVHLDRGGQPARAVPLLQRAADVATQVSAHEEALRCLRYALSLLDRLPAGRERDELELALRSSLSIALNSARGYADPEVERNLDRVFVLVRASGDGEIPVRWLWVAFTLRFMQGDLRGTLSVAEQAVARSVADPSCRCEAHHAMAGTLSSMGELEASRRHFEAALSAYDERHPRRSALGSDLGVFAHSWYSHALWLLGEDADALAQAQEGIALARRLDHPFSETLALAYAGLLHQMRRDIRRTLECAEAVVERCERYGFAYYGDWARVLIGWARGQEHPAEGVRLIESALARLDAHRAQARRPYYMSLLAQTCSRAGSRERAAAILDEAIAMALARSDVWYLPALYFEKSVFEAPPVREVTLRRGLDLARAQNNRGLEQRILAAG